MIIIIIIAFIIIIINYFYHLSLGSMYQLSIIIMALSWADQGLFELLLLRIITLVYNYALWLNNY